MDPTEIAYVAGVAAVVIGFIFRHNRVGASVELAGFGVLVATALTDARYLEAVAFGVAGAVCLWLLPRRGAQ